VKTRRFENILRELELSYCILRECGTHLGGVHFELTARMSLSALGAPAE